MTSGHVPFPPWQNRAHPIGITIYYHGGLDDPAQLDAALEMLRDECARRNWPYHAHVFEARGTFKTYSARLISTDLPGLEQSPLETNCVELDTRWRGLIVKPHPDSEALMLMFDQQTAQLMLLMEMSDGRSVSYHLGIKTQFAPIEIHMGVCEVLHRLQDEFGRTQLHVHDEGGYFDTGDVEPLRRMRQQIDDALNNLELLTRLAPYATAGDEVAPPDEEQLAGRLN